MARWHLWRIRHPAWRWWLLVLVVALALAVAGQAYLSLDRDAQMSADGPVDGAPPP